jgi:sec-independent protein translocase protein TatA
MAAISMAIWTPGWLEIVIILGVLLLVFGKRLPEVMRNLGKGLTQFKRGMRDTVDELKDDVNIDAAVNGKSDEGKPSS